MWIQIRNWPEIVGGFMAAGYCSRRYRGPVQYSASHEGFWEQSAMATIGTLLKTWVAGSKVGEDAFGNRYYRGRGRSGYRRERRWVVYKGAPEASKVPPEWHAWLHYTMEAPLDPSKRYTWQKEHAPNLTGTRAAYVPPGSVLRGGKRRRSTGDYEPWIPQQ
jgi:NADH:ubiquinone oxidoreductase subunit